MGIAEAPSQENAGVRECNAAQLVFVLIAMLYHPHGVLVDQQAADQIDVFTMEESCLLIGGCDY